MSEKFVLAAKGRSRTAHRFSAPPKENGSISGKGFKSASRLAKEGCVFNDTNCDIRSMTSKAVAPDKGASFDSALMQLFR
jgi:hypothetical protein